MSQYIFIANAAVGNGLSGSDRIFIELAKRWAASGNNITICVSEDGYKMCNREGLTEDIPNIHFQKWFLGPFKNTSFVINYIFRIISGIYYSITTKFDLESRNSFVYSCSDFWQDSLPACILKYRYSKLKLIGSFYLAAPNPFIGFNEVGKAKIPSIKSIIYFLQQQPIFHLFKKYAEYIFVTSVPDAKRFPAQNSHNKVIIVKGGVDIKKVNLWKNTFGNLPKIYDAVFLGRFHQQKGVLELVSIWKEVLKILPDAKLIMIGDGPLMNDVKRQIEINKMQNNVLLTGYLFDGEQKYRTFAQSKLVVHPAVYDSGGMAAAEAMAWGLPGVAFDLEALKTYYPEGMIKVKPQDNSAFAKSIINLLQDDQSRFQLANEAYKYILQWDWDKRSKDILELIEK